MLIYLLVKIIVKLILDVFKEVFLYIGVKEMGVRVKYLKDYIFGDIIINLGLKVIKY